ncbi:MAG: S8 family serine peptidase [bacterium]|nr:S8 family serine peptidase [bacterium]
MMRCSRSVTGILRRGLLAGGLAVGLSTMPAAANDVRPAPSARRAVPARPLSAHLQATPAADVPDTGLPAATMVTATPAGGHRARRTAAGTGHRADFTEVDLTARTKSSAQPDTATARQSPAMRARLRQLTDPFFLRTRGAAAPAAGGDRRAQSIGSTSARSATKAAPWSANALLGNPTNMNDDHVTLATSPDGSVLYAAFSAVDLGSTDRDIHVARSLNQGLTWQVWELPSFTTDEYQPELAVDGGGYLHVVWIRDDGVILRSRSSNPGDPSAWAWVKGLTVGEPCAVPSIAVTGAGDFAKVFIAANWLTVNYDYYQYEWTLIFMYSSNGGNTVTYDYFLPDGYPDYWPDVAMDAGTVHFVNAEQDAETGEMEILIATDAYTGSFASPASFTGWTPSNGGYPRVACQGQDVYVAYQLDYTDGITSDGDIIYTHSADAGASFYGPYGLVADEYDSVGPSLFVRGGVVGCTWLDAPNGGDEFHLATRLASGHGAADFFGDVEVITDAPTVEPVFHAADAVLSGVRAHAAWSDRRDFPTQGRNVYTARRDLRADLAAFTPAGWGDALVANMIRGQRATGYTAAGDTNWVSFAFLNAGLLDIPRSFLIDLELDGVPYASWQLDGGLPAGSYVPLEDFPLTGPAGAHTLTVRLDPAAQIAEDDETDNAFARSFEFLAGDPGLRFRPSGLVTIVNPYLKRAEALTLAQDPPLRREAWLDPVDPRLREAMAGAQPGGLLPVMIVPAERLDPERLAVRLQGATRSARREAIALAARAQVALAMDGLRPLLAAAANAGVADSGVAKSGAATAPRALWLSGSIRADLSPATITALAAEPGVGRLWLDDTRSRTFGGALAPAGTDGTTTAPDKALAWHLQAIGADQAWAAGNTGAGVLVGHLDSGVAYDHPDLASRLWNGGAAFPHHGWDAVDEDDDPYDGDTTWHHGTHTAGLIVGDGTAGTTTGVAPGARVMALRVVPGYQADLVEGLQFGLEHGVHLFSMSAGWSLAGSEVRAANRYNAEMLLAMDVPLFAAAGNGSPTGHYAVPTDIASPADCPSPWYAPGGGRSAVITIGGLTNTGAVESSSSYGPTSWNIANPYGAVNYRDYPYPPGLMKPDLAAPGTNVTSLAGAGGYVAYTGTSMACPQVAAAAAILLGASPGLDPAQLAEALETSATDISAAPATAGRDPYTGAGRIHIPSALAGVPMGTALEFTIQNTGNLPLVLGTATPGANWISVDQPPAWLDPGLTARLSARIEPAGLLEGVHETFVAFTSNAPGSPHLLPVQLIYGDYATGVGDDVPVRAAGRLDGYPNPFNPRTTLRFALAVPARAILEVHDPAGRLVRRLLAADLPAGAHDIAWDGKDDAGRAVASGQYLARLRAGDAEPVTRKLMLVR